MYFDTRPDTPVQMSKAAVRARIEYETGGKPPRGAWPDEFLAQFDVIEPVVQDKPDTGRFERAVLDTAPSQQDGAWVLGWTIEAVPVTEGDVIAERRRRQAAGFTYDFADERGLHHIGTTDQDMRGWDEVTTWSNAMINLGNAAATTVIVTETGPAQITATDWQSVLAAAAAFRQPIWAASFALSAMTPIPADFADDQYWP